MSRVQGGRNTVVARQVRIVVIAAWRRHADADRCTDDLSGLRVAMAQCWLDSRGGCAASSTQPARRDCSGSRGDTNAEGPRVANLLLT